MEDVGGGAACEALWQAAKAEDVTVGGTYFNARHDEETIDGEAIGAAKALLLAVEVGFDGVVVSDCDTAEPFFTGRGNELFGRVGGVAGEPGMDVQIEGIRHEGICL